MAKKWRGDILQLEIFCVTLHPQNQYKTNF